MLSKAEARKVMLSIPGTDERLWFNQPFTTIPKYGVSRHVIPWHSASVATRPVSMGRGGFSTVPCAASTSATSLPPHPASTAACSST